VGRNQPPFEPIDTDLIVHNSNDADFVSGICFIAA
jgi:hypothetical protein